ncbi:hypothetical protein RRG08_035329 [Elysia crispata]|uniref:Uncharacterized protein n=1 Tax=Elysia crispata TaxID=231223 RepID=A0AAE0Y3S4_9GAST|nr:hypothetical protein RRG08_035329 [Elysia crispata]
MKAELQNSDLKLFATVDRSHRIHKSVAPQKLGVAEYQPRDLQGPLRCGFKPCYLCMNSVTPSLSPSARCAKKPKITFYWTDCMAH